MIGRKPSQTVNRANPVAGPTHTALTQTLTLFGGLNKYISYQPPPLSQALTLTEPALVLY